jgi:YesN/AraC family two-component response regulator
VGGQADMSLVAEASNGREAIQQFRTHHPDITLMDSQMPEMSGLDEIIAIRGEFPEARIIVLTTYAGDVQVLRALKAGARGYLLKNSLHKELLATIRSVHAGKRALSTEASMQLKRAFRACLLGFFGWRWEILCSTCFATTFLHIRSRLARSRPSTHAPGRWHSTSRSKNYRAAKCAANQPGSDPRSCDCRRNTTARRFMDAHRGSTSGNH